MPLWYCILSSAVEAPNFKIESISPTGQISPNHTQWSIQFDRKVRMTVAKVICFHAGILVLLFNFFLMCYVITIIIIIM